MDSFIVWRHDVEYSVSNMHHLVEIDTDEQCVVTLFVQTHSDLYNFWDPETVAFVRQWIKWGHHIGLHFDCAYYGLQGLERLEELIGFEGGLLERIYDTEISAFSFHNPHGVILQYRDNYAGLVNAYNRDLFGGDVVYVSDSNGRWREKTIRDVLENPGTTRAQVNVHDTWWTNRRIPQIEKLESALRSAAERKIARYKQDAHVVVEDII